MRVALISDVHTNLPAWDALMDHWLTMPAAFDQIWSLGDWLGYHDHHPLHLWDRISADRFEAMRDLRMHPSLRAVIGNHDIGVLDGSAEGLYNGKASQMIKRQREMVRLSGQWQEEFAPWLRSQPYMLSPFPGVYLAHGVFYPDRPHLMPGWYAGQELTHEQSFTELNNWHRQSPIDALDKLVASYGWHAPVILVTGHTHQQGVWQRPQRPSLAEDWPMASDAQIPLAQIVTCAERCVVLEHTVSVSVSLERPVWINPGSVGQARDKATPRPGQDWNWARYAVLEWDVTNPAHTIIQLYWLPYQDS